MQIGTSIQIITQEATTWPRYMAEENERPPLIRYAIILILVANIAHALGSLIFNAGFAFMGIGATPYLLTMYALKIGFEIIALLLIPKILAAIAPSFSGEKNEMNALKLYVYAMTPVWLGTVLMFIPFIGILGELAGAIYAIYLFWKHSSEAMAVPEDKKIGFVLVSALAIGAAFVVFAFITTAIVGMIFVGYAVTNGYHG